jgi:hypothetical protein
MAATRYKVRFGTHREHGVIYKSGEIFESYSDLTKMFPGRFEVIDGKALVAPEPMTKALVRPVKGRNQAAVDLDVTADAELDDNNPPPLAPAKPEGKDVTKHFPKAVEEDFRVYKLQDGSYNVFDADDLSRPVNDEKLTKPEINTCIRGVLAAAKA